MDFHVPISKVRKTSYVMQRGFSTPNDSCHHGDGYVPVASEMASMSGSQKYRNSVFIPERHAFLPNAKTTIEAIRVFLLA
jgi:hypothetical protein